MSESGKNIFDALIEELSLAGAFEKLSPAYLALIDKIVEQLRESNPLRGLEAQDRALVVSLINVYNCIEDIKKEQERGDNLKRKRKEWQTLLGKFQTLLHEVQDSLIFSAEANAIPLGKLQQPLVGKLKDYSANYGKADGEIVISGNPPWEREKIPFGDSRISRLTKLPQRIEQECECGLNWDTLKLLDVFARAGEIPLLVGKYSDFYIQRYAACVTSGEYSLMHLDMSMLGVNDLWRTPGGNALTALAISWQRAILFPQYLHIVCLHSLNHAPFHLWLNALMSILRSSKRPSNLVLVASAAGGMRNAHLAENYRLLEELTIPLDCSELKKTNFELGNLPKAERIELEVPPKENFENQVCSNIPDAILFSKLRSASYETVYDYLIGWPEELCDCLREGRDALKRFLGIETIDEV